MSPSPEQGNPELRMAGILADRLRELGTYVLLARAVSAANGIAEGATDAVDRRKLKKIVEGERRIVFTLAELHALDRFLEPLGGGLTSESLFVRENILQSLAAAAKPVCFLLGSRPSEDHGLNLSHWDVKALAEVLRGVNNFAPNVSVDIRDVLLRDTDKQARESIRKRSWAHLLDDGGPSLVFLGSSRASHATEAALARMTGVKPYRDRPKDKERLPFHFVWPAGIDHGFPSCFRYTAAEVEAFDPESAREVAEEGVSGLEIDREVHIDRLRKGGDTITYGICAAQRRPGGQIWLVLAGVTGAATFAAAELTHSLPLGLPRVQAGQVSDVSWAAVQAFVQMDDTRLPDKAQVVLDRQPLGGPRTWEVPTGE